MNKKETKVLQEIKEQELGASIAMIEKMIVDKKLEPLKDKNNYDSAQAYFDYYGIDDDRNIIYNPGEAIAYEQGRMEMMREIMDRVGFNKYFNKHEVINTFK